MYMGMYIDIVLPKRSRVRAMLRAAICSRNGSAAGEISAMKPSIPDWEN